MSVKIISYSISSSDLDKIVKFLKKNKIIKPKKFKSMRFGVIYTTAKNEKISLIEKAKKSDDDFMIGYIEKAIRNHLFGLWGKKPFIKVCLTFV